MNTVFFVCAAVGGSILVIQVLLQLIGLGGDADADVHDGDFHDLHDSDGGDSDGFFKFLSFKTLIAFLTFFGLTGLAGQKAGMEATPSLLMGVGAGALAMFAVAYIMTGLTKLQSTGNVDLQNAVGEEGRVYLRVPGARAGQGKVIVEVQGRRLECKAVTAGGEIPTGAQVRVVAKSGPDTVEVQPA